MNRLGCVFDMEGTGREAGCVRHGKTLARRGYSGGKGGIQGAAGGGGVCAPHLHGFLLLLINVRAHAEGRRAPKGGRDGACERGGAAVSQRAPRRAELVALGAQHGREQHKGAEGRHLKRSGVRVRRTESASKRKKRVIKTFLCFRSLFWRSPLARASPRSRMRVVVALCALCACASASLQLVTLGSPRRLPHPPPESMGRTTARLPRLGRNLTETKGEWENPPPYHHTRP